MTSPETRGPDVEEAPSPNARPVHRVVQQPYAEEGRVRALAVLSSVPAPYAEVRRRLARRRQRVGALSYRLGELGTLGYAAISGARGSYEYAITREGETYLNEEYA